MVRCTKYISPTARVENGMFLDIQHTRPEPIMLFKLPIMLLSNAPKYSLLCPNYAPL